MNFAGGFVRPSSMHERSWREQIGGRISPLPHYARGFDLSSRLCFVSQQTTAYAACSWKDASLHKLAIPGKRLVFFQGCKSLLSKNLLVALFMWVAKEERDKSVWCSGHVWASQMTEAQSQVNEVDAERCFHVTRAPVCLVLLLVSLIKVAVRVHPGH